MIFRKKSSFFRFYVLQALAFSVFLNTSFFQGKNTMKNNRTFTITTIIMTITTINGAG